MQSIKFSVLVSIFFITLFYSCSQVIIKENDISYLPPNFFICDSVNSTPLYFQFKWTPKLNDSVSLKITGDVCSGISLQSRWSKDSIITLELDAKKSAILSFDFLFALSEKCYNANFTASINGYELINRNEIIFKDSLSSLTRNVQKIYLPIYRYNSFVNQNSKAYIESLNDKIEITSVPFFDEDLDAQQAFTITDYLNISIDSDLPIAFYDRFLDRTIGKQIVSRVNDFCNYRLCYIDSLSSSKIDTVSISYTKDDFESDAEILISKDVSTKKFVPTIIMALIGDGSMVYPGDTVDVHLSYKDSNGFTKSFNQNTLFEAGLTTGCSVATILSKDGLLKNYFRKIQQPIRLVILEYNDLDKNDNNVGLRIGINPDDFIDCNEE